MATIILDVPSEKIRPFVKMVLALGLDKHRISSGIKTSKDNKRSSDTFFSSSYSWDLNKNELEFE
jgi:hypothetical protein